MDYTCPVCGYLTFNEPPGSYDNCSVCGWEDDLSQLRFPNTFGANKVTLVQAQKNYAKFGYSTPSVLMRILFKHDHKSYKKDQEWRILDENDYIEEPVPNVEYGNTYPEDSTYLYYWSNRYQRK